MTSGGRGTISAIVIALNEERNIAACLDSLAWADEVVVVDGGSTDATAGIAEARGAAVVREPWRGYGHARNVAAARASGEWILAVDADERVPQALAAELRGLVRSAGEPPFGVYEVARRAYFLGRWIRHCGWYPGYTARFYRKGAARYDGARVHERLLHDGPAGRLRNDLEHYTDDNLFHYLHKLDRYTTLAAADLADRGRTASALDLAVRPLFQFVRMYLLRLGLLDGVHGLTLSLFSSAYVFVKYAKLRERDLPTDR